MPPTSNRADPKDSHKVRVLLVDDNEAFLRAATEFLQETTNAGKLVKPPFIRVREKRVMLD